MTDFTKLGISYKKIKIIQNKNDQISVSDPYEDDLLTLLEKKPNSLLLSKEEYKYDSLLLLPDNYFSKRGSELASFIKENVNVLHSGIAFHGQGNKRAEIIEKIEKQGIKRELLEYGFICLYSNDIFFQEYVKGTFNLEKENRFRQKYFDTIVNYFTRTRLINETLKTLHTLWQSEVEWQQEIPDLVRLFKVLTENELPILENENKLKQIAEKVDCEKLDKEVALADVRNILLSEQILLRLKIDG